MTWPDIVSVETVTKDIARVLDEHEKKWVEKQQILIQEKMKKDVAQAQQTVEHVQMLLQKCKARGGPMVTIDELESCICHQNREIESSPLY